jgi:molybdopterin-containing oxidoreductase family membrane subunit
VNASPSYRPTLAGVTDQLTALPLSRAPRGWWLAFGAALALAGVFVVAVLKLLLDGVGIWGVDIPVAWGFAIANYIWWIGIGMAGTFISAALHLTRQDWRSPLNRYAEAMTVFAVAVSGFFPILHLGRPWFFYWLAPYPNIMNVWPQWRSSLLWDFFAILAYLIVSILYWYTGLLPDLATLRDRAPGQGRRMFYGLLALGWRGEARQWQRHQSYTRILAGLAVPLVFSVHSMVAVDLSEGMLPGWHSTLFPPFFVAGALYSGFAMALVLGLPMRAWLCLHRYITAEHLDKLAKILLAVGLLVAYSYAMELFMPLYSQDRYELANLRFRLGGDYAWVYCSTLVLNVLPIQALWWRGVRTSPRALFGIGLAVVVGMWLERYMLLVTSLYRDYLPSSWGYFVPTRWDWLTLAGSVGVFFSLFLLFVRLLPVVSMAEMRAQIARRHQESTA